MRRGGQAGLAGEEQALNALGLNALGLNALGLNDLGLNDLGRPFSGR
jgi:hypothetical protein